ncbi:hypothetical protein LSAT2_014635 [Lamellibrachia satsuma]|nr:hypothetical protein LSAT2_014635 [Lamellibrachia satsuma]
MSSPSATNDVEMGTPVLAGKHMSSSLRERLKRSGRSYKSPAATKYLCRSDIESPPPSCLTPNPSASSPPVCRETPVGSEISPDAAKCISSTMTNAKRSFVETDQASGNIRDKANMSTEPRDSVDDEGRDTYSTPSRNKHNTCDVDTPCNDGVSSTPVRPCSSDQAGVDTTVESLKKHKAAIQEKIARDEERLRKLKMVKMYRTKNNLTELQRLIELWRSVSQRALEQLLEQAQEPGATMRSLIDHLQLSHELIGYNAEDDSFV